MHGQKPALTRIQAQCFGSIRGTTVRFIAECFIVKISKAWERRPQRRIVALVDPIPMQEVSHALQTYDLNACGRLNARSASHRLRTN